jgi:hypothetical protein
MGTKTKTVFMTPGKTIFMIAATAAFMLLLIIMPMKGYGALCAKQDKSTAYFNGYDAAQSDFHSGHAQNQNVSGSSSQYSQDYKQGYKDGWDDAQYNVNVLESSIC